VVDGACRRYSLEVKRDGTLQGAIEAFGRPASIGADSRFRTTCYVRWPDIGLRITFYNLGGSEPVSATVGLLLSSGDRR
jgi:hypothetical protein